MVFAFHHNLNNLGLGKENSHGQDHPILFLIDGLWHFHPCYYNMPPWWMFAA